MGAVRQQDSLVSEGPFGVWRPSAVAAAPPTVRLARLCPAMACSGRRRSSWRKVQCVLWIGAIERCVSCTHHCYHATPARAVFSASSHHSFGLKNTSGWEMQTRGISESTPLLRSPYPSLPYIRPVIDRLLAQSNTTPSPDHILAQFPSHRDLTPSNRTAFVLITLLQIGCDARKQLDLNRSLSLWDAWDNHLNAELVAEHCSSHVLEVWSNFLRVPRSNAHLDALLWTVFLLREDNRTGVCRMFSIPKLETRSLKSSTPIPVVDFLCQNFGEGLLVHPLILSTVSWTWKHGRVVILPQNASFSARVLHRTRSLGTPRCVD